VLGWGVNTISVIAPGGASVAFATPDGHLEVRRWSDGAVLGIDNGLFGATAIGYSADGTLFAASTTEAVKVWRISDGALLSSIPALANGAALGISNDGSVVAVSRNGQVLVSRPAGLQTLTIAGAAGVAVSPDGMLVAVVYEMPVSPAGSNHTFWNGVWRVSDGQPLWSSNLGRSTITNATHAFFSRDGALVGFGLGAFTAGLVSVSRVLKAGTGAVVSTINGELLAFSDDGLGVVGYPVFSGDYAIFRVSDGVAARSITLPTGRVIAAGFSTGTTTLAVGQSDARDTHALYVDGTQVRTITRVGAQSALNSVAISPDGTMVVAGSGQLWLWNATTASAVANLPGGPLRRQIASFSGDSTRLATCGSKLISVVTVKANGNILATPTALFTIPVTANAVAFSPDGMWIATGNEDNTASIWSAADGSLARTLWNLSGHTFAVQGIAFSPDSTRVATAGADRRIKVWNAADGSELRTIDTGDAPDTVTFSPDGSWVIGALGSPGSGAAIWDVATGVRVRSLSGTSNAVISPSGSELLMGEDGGVQRFSLPAFADLGLVPQSVTVGFIRSLAATLSGSVVASIADSAVVRLWCLR
jgi:WD40 repeat protein